MDEQTNEVDLESRVYRNHFTIVVQSMVSILIMLGIMGLVGSASSGGVFLGNPAIWIVAVVGIVYVFISIRIWMKTTFTFGPTEIVVVKDTFFKNTSRIQYSKLASVNVRRSFINHIFGTTTLLFNVNSSVNSMSAEATLTLEKDEADRLREMVSAKIFQKQMVIEEDKMEETLVDVSNFDVILHGFFGQPTRSSILGLVFLAYSIITMFVGEGSSLLGWLMFGFTSIIPWIRTILRYYNYRIYRIDDTITVESGLINKYRSSFNIKKVNSVRIREPLLARAMGKSLLEAEVVGLADNEGLPLLCPLKNRKIVDSLTKQLVPEFIFDSNHQTQPKESLVPTMTYKILWAAVFLAVGITLYFFVTLNYDIGSKNYAEYILYAAVAMLAVVIPILLIVHGILAQKNREFEMGQETFLFIIGAYDRQREYIRYDKVQMCDVTSGPVQRMFGVGTCNVRLMSAQGFRGIRSGLFRRDELELIGKEVMDRIRDGRYDYRKYL
ncbi:MAG: PH domain-containing protein [Candidatus Methanomethylophilaceae archaeon]|nr:PH domain-containing protein [Candidatus Methanomethylophilaceae archaeon]